MGSAAVVFCAVAVARIPVELAQFRESSLQFGSDGLYCLDCFVVWLLGYISFGLLFALHLFHPMPSAIHVSMRLVMSVLALG